MADTRGFTPGNVTLSIGLLGVEVPAEAVQNASSGYLACLRLDEVERRILAIEAALKSKAQGE